MIEPGTDFGKDSAEILEKISGFQSDHAQQLGEFNKFYKHYRAIPTKTRKENQSNTFVPELFVEVEAIATAIFEMIFSDASNSLFFDITGEDGGLDDRVRAQVTKAVISKQLDVNELQSKVLPWLRMLVLNGIGPVAVPWRYEVKPAFDCWDFEPVKAVNFSFDDSQTGNKQSWSAQTFHSKSPEAFAMVRHGMWGGDVVRNALTQGMEYNVYEREQRQAAGYFEGASQRGGFTAHEYYGTLDSHEDGLMYWAFITSKGDFLMEPRPNLYSHGESVWLTAEWFSLPEEPYPMGLGHINHRTQSEINDRRNFINDLLYASLYNQWLRRSDSGIVIPGNKMKYTPHQIIDGDVITDDAFRALRPDMSALGPAINLEGQDIDKMRRHSGATTTLQAIATGTTATEATQIQSEATRRVKAMVRSNISTFLKRLIIRAHQLNLQFLDKEFPARVTNSEGYEVFGTVTNADLSGNPDIRVKMSTDLDFRPFKRKELIEMLEIFTRLQNTGVLGARKIVPDPIVEELASLYGMDPRKFFQREGLMEMETRRATQNPAVQSAAMGQIAAESPAAQMRGPGLLAAARERAMAR